jgi:hypothetical protein
MDIALGLGFRGLGLPLLLRIEVAPGVAAGPVLEVGCGRYGRDAARQEGERQPVADGGGGAANSGNLRGCRQHLHR